MLFSEARFTEDKLMISRNLRFQAVIEDNKFVVQVKFAQRWLRVWESHVELPENEHFVLHGKTVSAKPFACLPFSTLSADRRRFLFLLTSLLRLRSDFSGAAGWECCADQCELSVSCQRQQPCDLALGLARD